MSWIEVMKDNKKYLITSEAYNDLFKQQGYVVISNKANPTQKILNQTNKNKEGNNGIQPKSNKK